MTHASGLETLWMDAIQEIEGFDRLGNRCDRPRSPQAINKTMRRFLGQADPQVFHELVSLEAKQLSYRPFARLISGPSGITEGRTNH